MSAGPTRTGAWKRSPHTLHQPFVSRAGEAVRILALAGRPAGPGRDRRLALIHRAVPV
jgi:hypothetical protein